MWQSLIHVVKFSKQNLWSRNHMHMKKIELNPRSTAPLSSQFWLSWWGAAWHWIRTHWAPCSSSLRPCTQTRPSPHCCKMYEWCSSPRSQSQGPGSGSLSTSNKTVPFVFGSEQKSIYCINLIHYLNSINRILVTWQQTYEFLCVEQIKPQAWTFFSCDIAF